MITQFHKVTRYFSKIHIISGKTFPREGLEVTTRVHLLLKGLNFMPTSFFCMSFDSCLMSTPGGRNQLSKVEQKKSR